MSSNEEQGRPGEVLVSEATAVGLEDRYEFGPTQLFDLKGKGPTPARALLGRSSDVPIEVPST